VSEVEVTSRCNRIVTFLRRNNLPVRHQYQEVKVRVNARALRFPPPVFSLYSFPTVIYMLSVNCILKSQLLRVNMVLVYLTTEIGANGRFFVCRRRLSSSVTHVGGRPPPGRARGRSGGRHCTAGQYGYVPLGRHLV